MENPLLDPKSTFIKILWIIDILTTAIFTFEALIKIVSFGFVANGKDSYIRDGWNKMDFLIVVLSIIALTD
jgi:hypothetical protein